jgi:hypothetical protein
MRVLVISDIHGNLHALEAVLEAEGDRYDELWCLGDIVGYGARPNECVDRIRELASVVLAGNHDLAVLGKVNVDRFGGDAGRAARWTRWRWSATRWRGCWHWWRHAPRGMAIPRRGGSWLGRSPKQEEPLAEGIADRECRQRAA